MGKNSQALVRAIATLDPVAQSFADSLIDKVTVIVGESQLLLMGEVDRLKTENTELKSEHERMKQHTARMVVQIEGLRQDVEALMTARMVSA